MDINIRNQTLSLEISRQKLESHIFLIIPLHKQ